MADEETSLRLISDAPEDEEATPHLREGDVDSEDDSIYPADEKSLTHIGPFVWVLTLSAGISGMLFGYDTGVISSTLVSIHSDLSGRSLTTLDKSLITSCTSLFALIASPVAGILADRIGRKKVILLADIFFIAGALWQALAGSVWSMIGGRSLVGLAIGGASLVTPLYISELAPSPYRGRLVTVTVLNITLGQVVAYATGYAFSSTTSGWRRMVGLGGIPALVQLVLLIPLPESPRWLVKNKDTDSARIVLGKVYGSSGEVQRMIDSILRGIVLSNQEEEAARRHRSVRSVPSKYSNWRSWHSWFDEGWVELFRVQANRRALAITCLLQGLQQLCGFNSLMYFSATIFESLHFSSPTLTALLIASTNLIFTLVSLLLIDRVGRRKILLSSIPFMVIGLVLASISYLFLPHLATSPSATPSRSLSIPTLSILISLILYVASYALGLGTVPWHQSELFALSVRSLGSSLATATNWGANFLVGLTFLPMMNALSPTGTFAVYAVICAAGWVMVKRYYPEVAGLGLEDIAVLLEGGWGVEDRLLRWAERGREDG